LNALKRFIVETGAETLDDEGEFTSIDPYDPAERERRRVPPEVTVEVDGRYL
jgi:hypothetical protein